MKQLCDRLRDLRVDSDMTQEDVAGIIGMSQSQYSLYESGTHTPSAKVLGSLADYYGVSADYLLGRTAAPGARQIPQTYLTASCSCAELLDRVLALNDENRKAVVDYVALLTLKENQPE